MSTLIHFRCREPQHLLAPSRRGEGGIVMRSGTAAYCDGADVDDRHHWVPTGGVDIETLFKDASLEAHLWEDRDDDDRAGARHISHEPRQPHPFATPS